MSQLQTYLALLKNRSRQELRYPRALENDYAPVDDKALHDLLAYCIELADCFVYINEDLHAQGSWAKLFSKSELSLLATLSHFCEFHAKQQLLFKPNTQLEAKTAQVLDYTFALDKWLASLNLMESEAASELRSILSTIISQRLKYQLRSLLDNSDVELQSAGPKNATEALQALSEVWDINDTFIVNFSNNQDLKNIEFTKSNTNRFDVDTIYYTFLGELSSINETCLLHFDALLKKQQHQPSVAMFITFLSLYQKVQGKINGFASKHLEHYYFSLLNIKNNEKTTERAFLSIRPRNITKACNISPDHKFFVVNAGDDTQSEVSFSPEGIFTINPVKIAHVLHLNVERDPLISPECLFGHCNQISTTERFNVNSDYLQEDWPLFGKKHGFIDNQRQQQAGIGFAIGAEDFLLQEGTRRIEITFSLSHASENANLLNFLNKLKPIDVDLAAGVTKEQIACLEQCFEEFERDFNLRFTYSVEALVANIESQQITQFFRMSLAEKSNKCLFFYLLQRLINPKAIGKEKGAQATILGLIFSRQLFSNKTWLNNDELAELETALGIQEKHNGMSKDEKVRIMQVIRSTEQYHHSKVLSQLFSLRITSALGWLTDVGHKTSLLAPKSGKYRFCIAIDIDPSTEAIVGYDKRLHGANYRSDMPIFEFQLNAKATYFGYGLLRHFRVLNADIKSQACGVTSLSAKNPLGPVDLSGPAAIFGTRPNQFSYFQIGYFEAAKKNVSEYSLHMQYAELPKQKGGFAKHYEAYDEDFSSSIFTFNLECLSQGDYTHVGEAKMFASRDGKLLSRITCSFVNGDGFRPVQSHITEQQFAHAKDIRNAYLRLSIKQPEYAFGHELYPNLLAGVLIENNRRKYRKPLPLPKLPYTPVVEKLSLDYTANSYYDFLKNDARDLSSAANKNAVIFHFSTLETREAKASNNNKRPDIVPSIQNDANLIIGLSSPTVPKQVSLFFDLQDNCELDISEPSPELIFKVYTASSWQLIPASKVLFDGTSGLTTAGIISLELPENTSTNPYAFAPDHYWIIISANDQAEAFPSIKQIDINLISVIASVDKQHFKPTEKWKAQSKDIAKVNIINTYLSQTSLKDKRELIASTSEKLRHKGRPVTALDFEQFVLDRFPSICIAKCFPHTNKNSISSDSTKVTFAPGHLLIVVLPFAKAGETVTDAIGASSKVLKDIQQAVSEVAPLFANVQVSNPLYERVQIRCSVRFRKSGEAGILAQALNQQISQYFDPFTLARKSQLFGWHLTCEEMMAYIQNIDMVKHVTNFSILHISRTSPRHYLLQDTVTMKKQNLHTIKSKYPWCLALPDKQHAIEVIEDSLIEIPNVTGIDEMKIGNNFILGA